MRKFLIVLIAVLTVLGLSGASSIPPDFQSTATHAQWNVGGADNQGTQFDVGADMWTCGNTCPPGETQTTWAYKKSHWATAGQVFGVEYNAPVTGQLDATQVKTYPHIEWPYYNGSGAQYEPALSSLKSIRSSFTVTMPDPSANNYDGEAAYDIWLNNWNYEIMIWVDNNGQTPAGNPGPDVNIYNQNWTLWPDKADKIFSFVLDTNESTGMVHELAMLRYLMNNGYVPSTATITSTQFGFELCTTHGTPMGFVVNNYTYKTGY